MKNRWFWIAFIPGAAAAWLAWYAIEHDSFWMGVWYWLMYWVALDLYVNAQNRRPR